MKRRAFLQMASAFSGAAITASLPRIATAASDSAPWRVFEVTTRVQVLDPEGSVRVWLPVPLTHDTDYFRNLGNVWEAQAGSIDYVVERKYAAGIITATFPETANTPVVLLKSRFATRDRSVDLSSAPRMSPHEDASVLRVALQATELIPTDGIVRERALEITRGQRSDIDKVRAIYEWIVENTFRDPKVRGCGWGDIKSMLETGNLGGKCGDLNGLFVGLARAAGIPARDVYGIRVARSANGYASMGANGETISKAQHCRAEFWSKEFGWVPVDPADVRKVALEEPPGNRPLTDEKVQRARARLFGYWEMNWLAYNRAHDLELPGASGWKVPYFMYPDGETGGGRLDPLEPELFQYTITARELTV